MADIAEKMLARPIRLAVQVAKIADEAQSFKQDCLEIKAKTEGLAGNLRQAVRAPTISSMSVQPAASLTTQNSSSRKPLSS